MRCVCWCPCAATPGERVQRVQRSGQVRQAASICLREQSHRFVSPSRGRRAQSSARGVAMVTNMGPHATDVAKARLWLMTCVCLSVCVCLRGCELVLVCARSRHERLPAKWTSTARNDECSSEMSRKLSRRNQSLAPVASLRVRAAAGNSTHLHTNYLKRRVGSKSNPPGNSLPHQHY